MLSNPNPLVHHLPSESRRDLKVNSKPSFELSRSKERTKRDPFQKQDSDKHPKILVIVISSCVIILVVLCIASTLLSRVIKERRQQARVMQKGGGGYEEDEEARG